jgi:hypothetical protein
VQNCTWQLRPTTQTTIYHKATDTPATRSHFAALAQINSSRAAKQPDMPRWGFEPMTLLCQGIAPLTAKQAASDST